MKRRLVHHLAAGAVVCLLAAAGCSGLNTAIPGVTTFLQQDRLARPVVNEVLATFANNRHRLNNTDNPTDDSGVLANDIRGFLTNPAGRSQATQNFIVAVLVPDVMKADLSQNTAAAYLGLETGGKSPGANGSTFGGRALRDDVIDTSLGIIFGKTVSALGGAPDDGVNIVGLTSDNVGPGTKNFLNTFPYVGNPV